MLEACRLRPDSGRVAAPQRTDASGRFCVLTECTRRGPPCSFSSTAVRAQKVGRVDDRTFRQKVIYLSVPRQISVAISIYSVRFHRAAQTLRCGWGYGRSYAAQDIRCGSSSPTSCSRARRAGAGASKRAGSERTARRGRDAPAGFSVARSAVLNIEIADACSRLVSLPVAAPSARRLRCSRGLTADGRQGRGRARDDDALDTVRCRWSWTRCRSTDMRAACAVRCASRQQAAVPQHALGQLGRRRHVVALAGLGR